MRIYRYLHNLLFHDKTTHIKMNELQGQIKNLEVIIGKQNNDYRIEQLRDKTLNCKESGVSNESYSDHEIIVSLTTFSSRIDKVYLAIESIMQGSAKPNRIILWLSEKEYKDKPIPLTLKLQQKRGLEIKYCKDIKSYKKLIPTLTEYPEAAIITIDDDVMYEYDLVERLVNAHIENSKSILACRMHRIVLDHEKKPLGYNDWKYCINDITRSPLNFPTGVGGVLFPPHCFTNEIFNSDVFLELCPNADDIWFYAMALLNGTPCNWVKTDCPDGYYKIIEIYPNSLCYSNTDRQNCGNDIQFKKVFERYNLWGKLV